MGIITETWLNAGDGLEEDEADFEEGTGYGMINRCRKAGARGVAHGGVSVVYRKSDCDLRKVPMMNRGTSKSFPLLAPSGATRGGSW